MNPDDKKNLKQSIGEVCPYRGVQPFAQEDNEYFAGRGAEIQIIISKLYASKLTVFYGESGCGKTSLIRAGVLPELAKPAHRVAALLFREWQTSNFSMRLRDEILKSLLGIIKRLQAGPSDANLPVITSVTDAEVAEIRDDFCKALRKEQSGLPLTREEFYSEESLPFDRFISECCAVFSGQLFFIFDQFEEYLYYHPEGSPGAEFDAAFARAINRPEIPASFLLSLRDDGLGKLDRLRPRVPYLLGNLYRLEHLTRSGASEAMDLPLVIHAQKGNTKVEIDQELKEKLLNQVREDRIGFEDVYIPPRTALPKETSLRYKALFLQIILTRLWEQDVAVKSVSRLQITTFETLAAEKAADESEAAYIVRTYFDDIMSRLDPAQQDDAAEILRFLIRTGGQKKAGRAHLLARDAGINDVGRVKNLLEALVAESTDWQGRKMSLLRKVGSETMPLYEFVHDVMGLALRDWCDRRRDLISKRRQHEELEAAEKRRLSDLKAAETVRKNQQIAADTNKRNAYILCALAICLVLAALKIGGMIQENNFMKGTNLIEEGNDFARQGKEPEAIAAYTKAKKISKAFKLVPLEEYEKFKPRSADTVSERALKKIREGNDYAREKKRVKAIEAYRKAIDLAPDLGKTLVPENEYERLSGKSPKTTESKDSAGSQ